MPRLAVFVSPHGFGHAARAAAVLEALAQRVVGLEIDLWTTVPEWFFAGSLSAPFRYRSCECDVGLVQSDAVSEDLPATVAALARLWGDPGRKEELLVRGLGADLRASGASAVLCDISPLGLLAARAAGLPSVLIENFTWDWIYGGAVAAEPRLAAWVERLRPAFAAARLRLQAEPVCAEAVGARRIAPVARAFKHERERVRERLGIAPGRALVLVSLGGIHSPDALRAVVSRARLAAADFVVPGGSEREERRGNLVLLPHRTPVYHPGLVAAADAVVGKLGYSTVAEAFAAGTRYAYLPRPTFRESAVLESFVAQRLPAVALTPDELASGAWVERLPELLARPRPAPGAAGGAEQAAEAIAALL